MHRAPVTHTLCTTNTNFLLTASSDGHLKFWHKTVENVEFVKDFKVADQGVSHLSASSDGKWAVCVCGTTAAIFDVLNFDMLNCLLLDYEPHLSCLCHSHKENQWLVILPKQNELLFYSLTDTCQPARPVHHVKLLHSAPITCLSFNPHAQALISTDANGMIEYCNVNTLQFPTPTTTTTQSSPSNPSLNVQFKFKSSTDLYELAKKKTCATSLQLNHDGTNFVIMARDKFIRIFHFQTGKLLTTIDETLANANRIQQEKNPDTVELHLEDFDFGKRISVEKAIDNDPDAPKTNVIFDHSGQFIIYPSMWGIKIVDAHTGEFMRLLGKIESTERFLSVSLFQGIIDVSRVHLANIEKKRSLNPHDPLLPRRATSASGEALKASMENDPTIFAAAYLRDRFYLFSRREPSELALEDPSLSRDIFNERPRQEDISTSVQIKAKPSQVSATVHTTMGDITVKLFGSYAPKAVENFTQLSKEGYFNNCIFHRVIKGFMAQTGDPTSTGMGGESIWGREFEDEISPDLKFDRSYLLAMANSGKDSNGSQWFITMKPTPWLNGLHTIFGEVTKGFEAVHQIENVKTGASGHTENRPLKDVKIVSVTITE